MNGFGVVRFIFFEKIEEGKLCEGKSGFKEGGFYRESERERENKFKIPVGGRYDAAIANTSWARC